MKSKIFLNLYYALLLVIFVPTSVVASPDMQEFLSPVACGVGWKIDGKALFYDRDTLSDRINGEAELYFPYGFDRMAAARYGADKHPGAGMDVEIYRMGSLLDAFGMFANYRQKDGVPISVGADSNLSVSQLFFYQGRYFVHIQVTGGDAPPTALAECGREVAARLPQQKETPPELSRFNRPEVVMGSERYLPQSLLGYDFLNKGMIADATVEGAGFQLFFLTGVTVETAATAMERYRAQLSGKTIETGKKGAIFLSGTDPLYGPVMVIKSGACFAGALKFTEKKGVRAQLERLCP